MGDEPAALDCEDEPVRRLVMPLREIFRPLQRIMRAVDLDRVEFACGIGEFVTLPQPFRIKAAAPAAITPARDADPDMAASRRLAGGCGAPAHRSLRRRGASLARWFLPRAAGEGAHAK